MRQHKRTAPAIFRRYPLVVDVGPWSGPTAAQPSDVRSSCAGCHHLDESGQQRDVCLLFRAAVSVAVRDAKYCGPTRMKYMTTPTFGKFDNPNKALRRGA